MIKGAELQNQFRALGLSAGDLVMVHSSMRAIGPVESGAETVLDALLKTIGPDGTLMVLASWGGGTYHQTLNDKRMSPAEKAAWSPFDPKTAEPEPSWGILNRFVCAHPDVRRSNHAESSFAAIGPLADELTQEHPLERAYGQGSPLQRFHDLGGKVMMLGAPLESLTILHYAENIADVPNKRMASYEMPMLGKDGSTDWVRVTDLDSSLGIVDYAKVFGETDGFEGLGQTYCAARNIAPGKIGNATNYLFDAQDLVAFGVNWLEANFRD